MKHPWTFFLKSYNFCSIKFVQPKLETLKEIVLFFQVACFPIEACLSYDGGDHKSSTFEDLAMEITLKLDSKKTVQPRLR